MLQRILVWDVPTRVFHWGLALSFTGAYLTAETERYRDLHLALGYIMLGLIAFRLLWGFVGSRYARFDAFLYGPKKVLRYLGSLLKPNPEHYVGHNPAGSLAIFLLLGLGLVAGISGILLFQEVGGEEAFEDLHEVSSNIMLGVVLLHIAGVVVSSLLHRENLVGSMITGYKTAQAKDGIRSPYTWLGVIMAIVMVAFLIMDQSAGPDSAPVENSHSMHDDD